MVQINKQEVIRVGLTLKKLEPLISAISEVAKYIILSFLKATLPFFMTYVLLSPALK